MTTGRINQVAREDADIRYRVSIALEYAQKAFAPLRTLAQCITRPESRSRLFTTMEMVVASRAYSSTVKMRMH